MPVTPEDRPLDALREATIDQLIMNYGHGELSLEAFQRRLDDAFDAQDHATLQRLTEDLEVRVDSGYVAHKRRELDLDRREPAADRGRDVEHLIHVFSGSNRTGEWTPARETRVIAIFGGGDLDFSDARFVHPTITVRIFCLFGGINIYVPENINTTVNTFSIFGGVDNKSPNTTDPDAPRLIVEGLVIFGGADVKVRKTFKQRLIEFADGVRAMFGQPERGSGSERSSIAGRIDGSGRR